MEKNALFCGLTTLDIQYFVDEFPEPNRKIKTHQPDIFIGGPAANAAITHSFLGGSSSFITCIGKNHFSQFITSEFETNKIVICDLVKDKNFSPIIASIVTTLKNGDRSVISHYPQPIFFDKSQLYKIEFNDFKSLIIDGFYPEAALLVCEEAKKNGITIILDGGSWKPNTDELLKFVDIAICSEQFLPPECKTPFETITFLQQKGIKKIAITQGECDILWAENNNCKSLAIKSINAIDSLGAGDIFHGAFVYFFNQKEEFEESLKKASIVASFSTLFKGTREWMEYYNYKTSLNW
jgi:sugar/nucleoside kinase (ribokinase family)